jgi:hypothetical protein
MPQGLQVFDQFGNLKVDLGDRILRFLGEIVVGPGPVSGSVVNDGLLTGTPFQIVQMMSNDGIAYWPGEGLIACSVSFSGNTMFYSMNSGQPTQRIQFGAY